MSQENLSTFEQAVENWILSAKPIWSDLEWEKIGSDGEQAMGRLVSSEWIELRLSMRLEKNGAKYNTHWIVAGSFRDEMTKQIEKNGFMPSGEPFKVCGYRLTIDGVGVQADLNRGFYKDDSGSLSGLAILKLVAGTDDSDMAATIARRDDPRMRDFMPPPTPRRGAYPARISLEKSTMICDRPAKPKRRRLVKTVSPTEKQIEVMMVVGECGKNFAEAGRRLAKDPKTVRQLYFSGIKNAGKLAPKFIGKPKTVRGIEVAGSGMGGAPSMRNKGRVHRDQR